jgi:hypothetical protein
MRAWRFYGFGDFRLDEVPVPALKPRHVLVEPLCVQPSWRSESPHWRTIE